MLPLILALALAQTGKTLPPGVAYVSDGCKPNWLATVASGVPINSICGPTFSAFPTSGAGTSGVCSTTAPTSANGLPLTFARTSSAMCTKTQSNGGGLATTGIGNGDLVSLPAGVARVEYDVDGVLGVLVENTSRTNSCVRSEELNNAAWATDSAGVAVPTVTPNATSQTPLAAPTSLPERLQIPATDASGTQYSRLYQAVTCTTCVCSFYVLGNGTSGTVDVCQQSSGSSCTPCVYNSASWTRCPAPVSAGALVNCTIGNMSLAAYNGGVARSAQDIFVTAAQTEAGGWMSSYIPTTSAAATRNAESASFTPPMTTATGFVFVESFYSKNTTNACAGFFSLSSTTGPSLYECFTNGFVARTSAGGFSADSPTAAVGVQAWFSGVRWGVAWDRANSKTASILSGTIGTYGAANASVTSASFGAISLSGDGIHSRICGDQSLSLARCK